LKNDFSKKNTVKTNFSRPDPGPQQIEVGSYKNFASTFSKKLYSAGKTKSKVTGHVYRAGPFKSGPNIHSYRKGRRRTYSGGDLIDDFK